MPPALIRLFMALLLSLGATISAPPAKAENPDAAELRAAAKMFMEFSQLYQNLTQNADKPDERIELGTKLLAMIDPKPKHWPPTVEYPLVKGGILLQMALAFEQSTTVDAVEKVEKTIAHSEAALANFVEIGTHPMAVANIQAALGETYLKRLRGEKKDNVAKSIAGSNAALAIITPEANAELWASAQSTLALAYLMSEDGPRGENVERAIAASEKAIGVVTRDSAPVVWGNAQHNFGLALWQRTHGDRSENHESAVRHFEAALSVRTREAMPRQWALTQSNLCSVYVDRRHGSQTENIEKAIVACEAALTVQTREAWPQEWASTKISLASAYKKRRRHEHADNLERTIASIEAALTVHTREADPLNWARAQRDLSEAYVRRIRGVEADNLEKALAAAEAALSAVDRAAQPFEWGASQQNVAHVYGRRVKGELADNQDKGIAHYEAALTVLTRETHPREWAQVQNFLALLYAGRIQGTRDENMDKVVRAAEAALTILTREDDPEVWATSQETLGLAYLGRSRSGETANARQAISHYEAALTVRTIEAYPRAHLIDGKMLGWAYLLAGDWQKASQAYAGAREAFLLLFGQGPGEAEARQLIDNAGELFAEAAFAALQRGDNEAGFALASEGRARQLAMALKLHTLALPPDQRQRADELRAGIRKAETAVEASEGAERSAAVDTLVALRGQLLDLVKSASANGGEPVPALRRAGPLLAKGGAIVMPVVTTAGTKVLIVTNASAGAKRTPAGRAPRPAKAVPSISVVDLPELTRYRLTQLMRGKEEGQSGGWLAAYNINYLPPSEQTRRWPEWLGAIDRLGPDLWGLFAGKVDAALRAKGVTAGARLIWMPTGALGLLPIGLAQNPKTRLRFADSYQIVYASSLEALYNAQNTIAKTTSASLTAIVNPTGDLVGTEKEGAIVASYFAPRSRTLLEGKTAKVDAVLAALKGRTHWHFASHGTFSWDDARASALLMHDRARLSVGRLFDTDGLGIPRLVVLSACETGLYEIDRNPDEFIGLPGAFTALGAAGVIATLWPVSDAATALLMAKFYELHIGGGTAPSQALRRAQNWLRKASDEDLAAYASRALADGRLARRHLAQIEKRLGVSGARGKPQSPPAASPSAGGSASPVDAKPKQPLRRPFAHPYYWAGFTLTGL